MIDQITTFYMPSSFSFATFRICFMYYCFTLVPVPDLQFTFICIVFFTMHIVSEKSTLQFRVICYQNCLSYVFQKCTYTNHGLLKMN